MSDESPFALQQLLDLLEAQGVRPGLETTRELLRTFDDPHLRTPTVLVAGTNGKGSVAALLSAMAVGAGYRTGLYTSPHLETVRERIRIDGLGIAAEKLLFLLESTVEASRSERRRMTTYFEALTIAAFRWFTARQVDLAVVEVGLGGRLDSTNVAEPILSVVTPVSLDHTHLLGETHAEIATEKAGILRAGRVGLIAPQVDTAQAALEAAAGETGAELLAVERQVSCLSVEPLGLSKQQVALESSAARYEFELALLGRHQVGNLATAVAAAEQLAAVGFSRMSQPATLVRAVADCRWPGRLEPVELPNGQSLLLDGAHNPDGVDALVDFLDAYGQPFDLLFGAVRGKDTERMLEPLVSRARRTTLTCPPSDRAVDPGLLAESVPQHATEVVTDPLAAAGRALEAAQDHLLVVCGSLYLVGEVRCWLRTRYGAPAPAADLGTPKDG